MSSLNSNQFETLMRRAKELQPAAEEYLALLAALSAGGDDADEDTRNQVQCWTIDARELLGVSES